MFSMNDYIRCRCGKLYKFFSMLVGNQSVCPDCRMKLEREYQETWNPKKPVKDTDKYSLSC